MPRPWVGWCGTRNALTCQRANPGLRPAHPAPRRPNPQLAPRFLAGESRTQNSELRHLAGEGIMGCVILALPALEAPYSLDATEGEEDDNSITR